MTNFYTGTGLTRQKGAVALFTSVMLMIGVTLVTFLTAKTVLQETKMTANNHRTQQAFASADAAMDFAVAYFNDGGFDHDGDGCLDASKEEEDGVNATSGADCLDPDGVRNGGVDVNLVDTNSEGDPGFGYGEPDGNDDILFFFPHLATLDGTLVLDDSGDEILAIEFDNNHARCSTAENMKGGLITTTGTSDDGTALRTISQCVGTRNLLKGDGPKQTLISGASVGLTGSGQIINRYSDLNIWSANTTAIGSSSAMNTYIRPAETEIADLTKAELTDLTIVPSIPNVQKVSSNGLGAGTDVYMNDTRLAIAKQATLDDLAAGDDGDGCDRVDADGDGINDCTFFGLFFNESKEAISSDAAAIGDGQKLAGGAGSAELNGLTGIIWVEGDASSGSTTVIGTPVNAALLVVEGDFTFNGSTIYGLLYVMGDLIVSGNPRILGTAIIEGAVTGGGGAAGGTPTLVYARNVGSDSDTPLKGTTAVVAGSWRDW